MYKRVFDKKRRYVIVLISIIALLLASSLVYAAYTNQAFKRGVVRNQKQEETRFSSNYMDLCPSTQTDFPRKVITYNNDSEQQLTLNIDVSNFAESNNNLVNERDIVYKFYVTISNAQNDKSYGVKDELKNPVNGICSFEFNDTLLGRGKNTDTFPIKFYSSDLNRLIIKVEAVPVESCLAYTNQNILGAVIYPSTVSGIREFTCTGKFLDMSSSNKPADFEAYNYEISISNGKAEVTLSWDNDLFIIDPFFKTRASVSNVENGIKFTMDQSNGTDTYIIPFYVKNGVKQSIDEMSWTDLGNKISVSAIEIKS